MNYAITLIILGLAAAWCARAEHRRLQHGTRLSRILAQHERDEQFRRDHAAGTAAGARDRLDALIEATRELPGEWGPGADEPIPYLLCEADDFREWNAELIAYHLEQKQEGGQP